MSEERLKKITDSVELQLLLCKQLKVDDEMIREEKELLNEVNNKIEENNNLQQEIDRLRSIIKEAIEYINNSIKEGEYLEDDIATDISEPSYDKYINSTNLLNILNKGSEQWLNK